MLLTRLVSLLVLCGSLESCAVRMNALAPVTGGLILYSLLFRDQHSQEPVRRNGWWVQSTPRILLVNPTGDTAHIYVQYQDVVKSVATIAPGDSVCRFVPYATTANSYVGNPVGEADAPYVFFAIAGTDTLSTGPKPQSWSDWNGYRWLLSLPPTPAARC